MKIYIDGIQADCEEASIKLIANSPIFQKYGGEAAIDISLPVTDINKRIFQYRHRPDTAAAKDTYEVVVNLGGVEKKGTGKIERVTSSFLLSVGFENSDFFHAIKDKTLRDLPWDTLHSGVGDSWAGQCAYGVAIRWSQTKRATVTVSEEIIIPGMKHQNSILEDQAVSVDVPRGYLARITGHIDIEAASAARIVVKQGRTRFAGRTAWTTWETVLPQEIANGDFDFDFMPVQLVNTQFQMLKFFLECDSVKNKAKQEIEVVLDSFNVQVLPAEAGPLQLQPYPGSPCALPSFFAPKFLSGIEDQSDEAARFSLYPKVNHFDAQEKEYPPFVSIDNGLFRNILCPMPYVAYIFDLIAEAAGYRIDRNIFAENPELRQLVLYNNYIENHFVNNNPNELMPTADWFLSDHAGDMALTDFLKIPDLFGAKLVVDSKQRTLSIIPIRSILNGRAGFDKTLPVEELEIGPGFDNVAFEFQCSETLAQELCIDTGNKKAVYVGQAGTLPENGQYKNIVRRMEAGGPAQYFSFVQGTDDNDDPIDGWKLAGMAENPHRQDDKAEKPYKVGIPIGPVFAGPVHLLMDPDRIYPEESDIAKNAAESTFPADRSGDWQATATVVHDSAILARSYESLEEEPASGLSFARRMADGSTLLCHEAGIGEAPCSIALRWEGENGLYETFWKDVARWMTSAKKVRIRIPHMDVLDFEALKSAIKIRINQQNYVVDTIQAEVGDTVGNVEIEAYTCL